MFIELTPTVCINTDMVEWVAKSPSGYGCIVCCGGKEYDTEIPYETITAMLKGSTQENTSLMQKLDAVLSTAQFNAG